MVTVNRKQASRNALPSGWHLSVYGFFTCPSAIDFDWFRRWGVSKKYDVLFYRSIFIQLNYQEIKMKLKSTLLAATLVVFAASTATSFAAEEHPADAKSEKAEVAKTENDGAKKPAKKVKKHSHMEEKTGMPMSETAAGMDKQESMKHMDMHDHTKDKH
jgi:hypothetical protein